MPSSHEKHIARVRARTRQIVADTRASCEEAEDRTHSSHAAIDRSLRLLRQRQDDAPETMGRKAAANPRADSGGAGGKHAGRR